MALVCLVPLRFVYSCVSHLKFRQHQPTHAKLTERHNMSTHMKLKFISEQHTTSYAKIKNCTKAIEADVFFSTPRNSSFHTNCTCYTRHLDEFPYPKTNTHTQTKGLQPHALSYLQILQCHMSMYADACKRNMCNLGIHTFRVRSHTSHGFFVLKSPIATFAARL